MTPKKPQTEPTPIVADVAFVGGDALLASTNRILFGEPLRTVGTASDPLTSEELAVPFIVPPSGRATSHLLDIAPINSKIVVVQELGGTRAVLATPERPLDLPAADPASKLPAGAVIHKVAEGKFEAHQLSPAIEYPVFTTATAGEAISGFVAYFHRTT